MTKKNILLLGLIIIIGLSRLSADVITLAVADGWNANAISSDTLSNLGQVTKLNTEDSATDVSLSVGKTLSEHKWIGVYFSTYDFAGYTIDSVNVKVRAKQKNTWLFCDYSNNKSVTKWSDGAVDNESGVDVNFTSQTISSANWLELNYDVSAVITSTDQVNNMEVLLRNDDASADIIYLDTVKVEVTCSKIIEITSAETVDDDLDGQIDAYHITFSTFPDDSTLTAAGFDVAGYTGESFVIAGLPNHPDDEDDMDIYISFNESGSSDTDQIPELTYDRATGGLQTLSGHPLLNVETGYVIEKDSAAPVMVSAQASDASAGGAGIQSGDTVVIQFSEAVSGPPAIDKDNIDSVFETTVTWKDVNGDIGSASWSALNSLLTITLSVGGGVPTIQETYSIVTDTFTIMDSGGNVSSHTIVISGSFGADYTAPVIQSRETCDLDSDGYIDAIRIVFNENIEDATVVATDFDVAGVTGEAFSPNTNGDTNDDSDIYITFTDGILGTDATPNVSYTQGSLEDLSTNNNKLESSSFTPSSDKAPPAIISATAGDGTILVPGIDGDDTVVIVFSEKTIGPSISAETIDSILSLSSAHTWKDGTGNISGAVWNSPDYNVLTVSLSTASGIPSVAVGDTITISSWTVIEDAVGNGTDDSIVLGGSFKGTDTTAPSIVSIFPEDDAIGVAVDTIIQIKFSENMDETAVKNAVMLKSVKDSSGNEVNSTSIPGTAVFNSVTSSMTFTPSSSLSKNFTYKFTISTTATDTIGNNLSAVEEISFTTIMDPNSSNTTVASDGKSKVVIPANSISVPVSVKINLDPVNSPQKVDSAKLTTANEKMGFDSDLFNSPIEGTIREINLFDADGNYISAVLSSPATVTIPYTETNGTVAGSNPAVGEDMLFIYYLDEEHSLWVKILESSVDKDENTVSASVTHFSVFALFGSGNLDLSGAYCFPVPFKGNRDTDITFTGLSLQATIKIYTINGKLVREIQHQGGTTESWNLKNDDGNDVASGVYLYIIENDMSTKKDKLMVIR
ncbi:MAG: Ig-like domain-containing protein [Elusimicrobia bacterium]|nr:Ig-like domain-containing protein [Elusimicrobiota bacterium]